MQTGRSGADVVLLFAAGLLVCVLLLTGFWLTDKYHVDNAWSAVAWFSVVFIPTIAPTLRGKALWKKPSFLLFFVFWMIAHAVIVTCLIKWVALLYWFPVICLEAFVGYLIANLLFGVVPSSEDET